MAKEKKNNDINTVTVETIYRGKVNNFPKAY